MRNNRSDRRADFEEDLTITALKEDLEDETTSKTETLEDLKDHP